MKNILLISGSLREQSHNTSLLKALVEELDSKASVIWADIDLPMYNQDDESDFPPAAAKFKEQIAAADVIVIATPEYNRGYPAVLKNAVDWASRPGGENSWPNKRVYVLSAALGSVGGALGTYQLKQVLMHLKARVESQEFQVASAHEKFTDGALTDEKTQEHLTKLVDAILED